MLSIIITPIIIHRVILHGILKIIPEKIPFYDFELVLIIVKKH